MKEREINCAAIIYGRGGSLGNFSVLSRDIVRRLSSGRGYASTEMFQRENIFEKHIVRRSDFFDFLENAPLNPAQKIKQIHIVSHSIGAGLFLSYGDPAVAALREQVVLKAAKAGRNVNYEDVLTTEIGAVLVDDLARAPFSGQKPAVRANLAANALIKIWGCNSAVTGWIYTDNGVTDPTDNKVTYYWRALNEKYTPKPSIAQAFADYFGCRCYGASSGSHLEVLHRNEWVSSAKYKNQVGNWPSGVLEHRLTPDRGNFDQYNPSPESNP